ncbi:MAG: porin [Gallionellaceae bacterium]|jgi:predicted porin|nr:porin [Gallionellaceae bacterium]
MQKKVIALAIMTAASAPAFADSGNVTIYGRVDMAYTSTDSGSSAGADGNRTSQVSSQATRLGFKGEEKIGDSLSLVWQIETQINLDDEAGNTLASRNSFLGLKSAGMGTVLLGRHDTPYKLATRGLDLFADSIADNRTLMGGGAGRAAAGLHDARPDNIVAWLSPDWSGFGIRLGYVAGGEFATLGTDVEGRAISADLSYKSGPFNAALAYQTIKYGSCATGVCTFTNPLAGEKAAAWKLGAGYKIGLSEDSNIQLNGVYERTSDSLSVTGDDNFGRTNYYLAGAYNFGNNAIKLAYTRAGNQAGAGALDYAARQWAIGYDHALSKRTKLYAIYTKVSNSDDAAYLIATSGSTAGGFALPGAGADPSALSIGVRHEF